MPPRKAWVTATTPSRLTASTRCQKPGSVSRKGIVSSQPAQLTTAHTGPTSAASRAAAAASVTSSSATPSPGATSAPTTRRPASARAAAVARPIPEAAPVTTATRGTLTDMTIPHLSGGCGCGAGRFGATEPPGPALYCHCTRCQRRTGTASSAQMRVAPGSVRVLEGEELLRAWEPEGGAPKAFCSACGSALFSYAPGTTDVGG